MSAADMLRERTEERDRRQVALDQIQVSLLKVFDIDGVTTDDIYKVEEVIAECIGHIAEVQAAEGTLPPVPREWQ